MRHLLSGLCALALCLSLTSPALALFDNKFEQELEKEQVVMKFVGEMERGGYKAVGTEQLKSWLDAGEDMVLVDTMPYEDSYKKGHIPGAAQFLFPIPEMASWDTAETAGKSADDYAALLGPDKGKRVVVYCGFVKCTRSHNGALWAVKLGYTDVYRHPGGIFAWKGADYPVETEE